MVKKDWTDWNIKMAEFKGFVKNSLDTIGREISELKKENKESNKNYGERFDKVYGILSKHREDIRVIKRTSISNRFVSFVAPFFKIFK